MEVGQKWVVGRSHTRTHDSTHTLVRECVHVCMVCVCMMYVYVRVSVCTSYTCVLYTHACSAHGWGHMTRHGLVNILGSLLHGCPNLFLGEGEHMARGDT